MNQNCPICLEDGGRRLCKAGNVIYSNTCKDCKTTGVDTKYIGETSRTLMERASEHYRDIKDAKRTSHMREHCQEEHLGKTPSFRFDLIKVCKTSLERQVGESICVKMSRKKGVNIINSKVEYNRCLLPTLTVAGAEDEDIKKKLEIRKQKIKEEQIRKSEECLIDEFQQKIDKKEENKRDRQDDDPIDNVKRMRLDTTTETNQTEHSEEQGRCMKSPNTPPKVPSHADNQQADCPKIPPPKSPSQYQQDAMIRIVSQLRWERIHGLGTVAPSMGSEKMRKAKLMMQMKLGQGDRCRGVMSKE